jgi:hypothetical protein
MDVVKTTSVLNFTNVNEIKYIVSEVVFNQLQS